MGGSVRESAAVMGLGYQHDRQPGPVAHAAGTGASSTPFPRAVCEENSVYEIESQQHCRDALSILNFVYGFSILAHS